MIYSVEGGERDGKETSTEIYCQNSQGAAEVRERRFDFQEEGKLHAEVGFATQVMEIFAKHGVHIDFEIPKLRGYHVEPMKFDL